MKIQTRLIVLLIVLLAVFGGCLVLLRAAHERETRRMRAEIAKERGDLLDRLLELTGLTLKNFAADYSLWSEMAEFATHGDPKWGEVNIEASLTNFDVNGAWVLRPDGTQVYGVVRELEPGLQAIPLPMQPLLARLGENGKFAHFFERAPGGMLEFRIAPIQPSDDIPRASPVLGWLVVARLWDDALRDSLKHVLEGEVDIQASPRPDAGSALLLQRDLYDWKGERSGVLHVTHHPAALRLLERENSYESLLFLLFGAAMLLFTVLGVSRWVIRPMRQLEQSLASNNPEPLQRLRGEPDEFGRLARLVESSFAHRALLEREVEERRRVEEALWQSQEDLRNAAGLKTRLARDLHDGVIQAIYAAGLGLEGIRASLRSDPEGADRRLVAAQSSLNQTIREVRSFIHGLEPEETDRPDFAQALRSLVSTLQALHAAELRIHLDPAPPKLNGREEVHALQIVRECVSNALRHGGAKRIDITFGHRDGAARLEIRDDGRGFDPAIARTTGGSGLTNLAYRAAEIGAELEIVSSPGKGTGVSLRFHQARSNA